MKMPNIPRLIFWELTRSCNLACAHCRAEGEEARAQYAADDYLPDEPYCVYQPKRTAP